MRWLAILLLLIPLATTQADDTPKSDKPDTPSTFEPNAKPGAGQAFLTKFEGDWDVAKVFYPRSGEPIRQKGTCSQKMIQGGRFLESRFTFGEGESATTGLGIIGFESDSNAFTSVWIDSRQTRMSIRHSQEPFDGQQIAMFSKSLDDTPNPRRSHTVSHLENDGKTLIHQQFAIAPDGSERLMMELILTRKP